MPSKPRLIPIEYHVKEFGAYIRRLREEAQWTQFEVGRVTGIAPAQLSRLENGVIRSPEFSEISQLCRFFSIPLEEAQRILEYGHAPSPKVDATYTVAVHALEIIREENPAQHEAICAMLLRLAKSYSEGWWKSDEPDHRNDEPDHHNGEVTNGQP